MSRAQARVIGGQALGIKREGQRVLVVYGDHTSDCLQCRSAAIAKRLQAYLLQDPAQVDRTARGFVRRMATLVEASQWSARRRAGRAWT